MTCQIHISAAATRSFFVAMIASGSIAAMLITSRDLDNQHEDSARESEARPAARSENAEPSRNVICCESLNGPQIGMGSIG